MYGFAKNGSGFATQFAKTQNTSNYHPYTPPRYPPPPLPYYPVNESFRIPYYFNQNDSIIEELVKTLRNVTQSPNIVEDDNISETVTSTTENYEDMFEKFATPTNTVYIVFGVIIAILVLCGIVVFLCWYYKRSEVIYAWKSCTQGRIEKEAFKGDIKL